MRQRKDKCGILRFPCAASFKRSIIKLITHIIIGSWSLIFIKKNKIYLPEMSDSPKPETKTFLVCFAKKVLHGHKFINSVMYSPSFE